MQIKGGELSFKLFIWDEWHLARVDLINQYGTRKGCRTMMYFADLRTAFIDPINSKFLNRHLAAIPLHFIEVQTSIFYQKLIDELDD